LQQGSQQRGRLELLEVSFRGPRVLVEGASCGRLVISDVADTGWEVWATPGNSGMLDELGYMLAC